MKNRICRICNKPVLVDVKTGVFTCDECKLQRKKKVFPKKCRCCGCESSTDYPIPGRLVCDKCKERLKNEEFELKKTWTEFIVCPLCLHEGRGGVLSRSQYITYQHLKRHGYTHDRFRIEFPDFKFKIKSLGEKHSEALSGDRHFNFGKHLTISTRSKIRNTLIETNSVCKKCKSCGESYSIGQIKEDLCPLCFSLR